MEQDMKIRMEQAEKKHFQAFMEKKETKLMISLIPSAEHPEVLEALLQSAFDAGVGSGVGNVLGGLVETMFKDKKDRP